MTLSDILALGSVFLSFMAFTVSFVLLRYQLKADFFSEYTRRYQDIIRDMPEGLFMKESDLVVDAGVLKSIKMYLDLCSEEWYLHKAGQVKGVVWNSWWDGMRLQMQSHSAYLTAWERFKGDYDNDLREAFEGLVLNCNFR